MKYVYDFAENGYTVVLDDNEFREEEEREEVEDTQEDTHDVKDLYGKMLSNNLSQSEKVSFSDDLDNLDVCGVCLLLLLVLVGAHYIVRGA